MRPDGSAGYRGLATCASVWGCPCCAARISAGRADELVRTVQVAGDAGLDAYLLTATVRHAWTDRCADTLAGVADAWRRLVRGAPWRRFCKRVGVVHWVRGMELTHGPAGWHPHVHVLVFVRREARTEHDGTWSEPAIVAEDADGWLTERWRECVRRELGDACVPSEAHGLDVRPAHAADYLAKLGLELAGADKRANGENRTPWQIAHDLRRHGRQRDHALWSEYVDATHGHRQLTWSRGLRDLAGLDDDDADDALLTREDELGRRVTVIDADTWRGVRARAHELLDVAELAPEDGRELAVWRAAMRIRAHAAGP
jgi:hypothetical protein